MERTNCRKTRWSAAELELFSKIAREFGNNYQEYEKYFPNRTYSQIKSQFHNTKLKRAKASDDESSDERSAERHQKKQKALPLPSPNLAQHAEQFDDFFAFFSLAEL